MNLRRLLPSPAMGVALLALVVAVGGTAVAANKIGTNQIKNNAVTKIKKKACLLYTSPSPRDRS